MYMKVKTEADAWELANRIFPGDYEHDPESLSLAGYPIHKSTQPGSNARICDLNNRLQLTYDNGHLENIWIEERLPKGTAATVGIYKERIIFGEVTVQEVKEIHYDLIQGLVAKTLDDGRPGIEITLENGETASFGNENVAYIRFS